MCFSPYSCNLVLNWIFFIMSQNPLSWSPRWRNSSQFCKWESKRAVFPNEWGRQKERKLRYHIPWVTPAGEELRSQLNDGHALLIKISRRDIIQLYWESPNGMEDGEIASWSCIQPMGLMFDTTGVNALNVNHKFVSPNFNPIIPTL